MSVQYRPIPDYPNYRVGDDGSVWRWVAGSKNDKRYPERWKRLGCTLQKKPRALMVLLHEGESSKRFSVAQLVLRAFVGPRPIGCIAFRFPDRDPLNCRLYNLRWAPIEAARVGRLRVGAQTEGERHSFAKLRAVDVKELRRMAVEGISFVEIGECYGLTSNHVARVVRGENWKSVSGAVAIPSRRHVRGSAHGRSKLNEPRVKAIKKMLRMGFLQREIAEKFEVTQSTISMIAAGNTWGHVRE